MSKFKFYLKDPASEKETPILMVIHWGGYQLKISTGQSILPALWNSKDKAAKTNKEFEGSSRLNRALDNFKSRVQTVFYDLEFQTKRAPTKDELRLALVSCQL